MGREAGAVDVLGTGLVEGITRYPKTHGRRLFGYIFDRVVARRVTSAKGPSDGISENVVISLSARRLQEAADLGCGLISGLSDSELLVLDAELRILAAHGNAFESGGRTGLVGRHVRDVIPGDGWSVLAPRYQAALAGRAQSFTYDAVSQPTTHRLRIAPIHDDGEVVGLMMLSEDITNAVQTTKRLADVERMQRQVLDVLGDGVLVLDPQGLVQRANPAALRMLDLDLDSACTDPRWGRAYGWRTAADGQRMDIDTVVSLTGQGVGSIEVEADLPNGAGIVLSVNFQALRNDDDEVSGLVLSFRDITESEADRHRLDESRDQLQAAHEVAHLACWELRPDTDEVAIFQALPGDEALAGTTIPLESLLGDRTSDDGDKVRADLAACMSGERDEAVRISSRTRPTGTVWLETRSQAVRDADGRVVCVRGTTQDVTEQELAKQSTARARDFFQTTLDSLSAHIAVLDEHGEIIMTNRAWVAFAAAGGSEAGLGDNYLAACDAASDDPGAARTARNLRAIIAGGQAEFLHEYPCHGPDGEAWYVLRAVRFEGRGDARVVISHEDVTERRVAEAQVATQATLLDEVDVAVIATDDDGFVTRWNRGAEQLYGWSRAEATGNKISELVTVPGTGESAAYLADMDRNGSARREFTVRRKDGSTFPASVHGRLMSNLEGHPAGRISVSVDMTERVASERASVAARDYMKAVADSMGEGLFTLDPEGRLIYINEAGEKLLGWSREELEGRVMHEVTHSHHPDGSEFAIDDCPIMFARTSGETLRVEDDSFIRRDGRRVPVAYTASPFETDAGVEGCAVVFEDISERKAYESELQREADKLLWIGRIQEALAEDRFVLFGQPIVDLASGEVAQCELLLRLRDPDGTIIGPGAFLQVAEQYGLIGEIDRWVIERGVEVAATGHPVQINLSAHSIGDRDILDHIETCITRSGADPAHIVFEITETAIVADEEAARGFAERLRTIGCTLALDDFGTGYGGFTYLKQLPIDWLKIDIEFVRDLAVNPGSRHVVEAVVALARGFRLKTVAEGVEDAEAYELLRELGVDFAQGYHIARPAPLEAPITGDEAHAR